jgi:hypothetical protein
MTHAGWSSLTESFLFGHPLVMLPLFADQGLTARLMAERRVGLEVPWDDCGSEDRAAGDGGGGREGVLVQRKAAKGLQEVLWDTARQERCIDELVEHLLQRRGDY